MDKLKITGGRELRGEVEASGAKNAALPILFASLLTADVLALDNVPQLQDISTAVRLLSLLGVKIERAGLEVRHEENLREHYARTCRAWCDNLDAHWDEAVAEVGLGTARVWALYLAGSALGFEKGQIQLHQVLAVKDDEDGASGFPLRLSF